MQPLVVIFVGGKGRDGREFNRLILIDCQRAGGDDGGFGNGFAD